MNKKILITGSAGFIGFHLWQLLRKEFDVIALDNISDFSNFYIKQHRLKSIGINADDKETYTSFYCFDINNSEHLNKLFQNNSFHAVIHLAAATGVRKSITHPEEYTNSNILGFNSILEACVSHGVTNIIYASSSSVYGDDSPIPFTEDANCNNPLSYYAVTKKNNELTAQSYSSNFELNIIGLRFFTVYGPWGRPDMANYKFIDAIYNKRPIELYNYGEYQRDFTYVDDITTSIQMLLMKMTVKQYHNEIFNIGYGSPVSISEYLSLIEKNIGKKAIYELSKGEGEEMLITYSNTKKLEHEIGFRPIVNLEEGIEKSVNWYKQYQKEFL